MSVRLRVLAVGAVCCLASSAFAATKGVTLEDRQQAACYDDVQRLCHDFIPDVEKTEACMKTKRSLVSKKCSDMYDVTQ